MLLSEINGEYQKKRMIVYNADGTKPIVHNIEVAPIFGNIYMSRLEKSDTRSYAACDLYLYLEDRGVGLLVGTAAEDDSLELVEGQVRRYRVGSEGEFLAMIRWMRSSGKEEKRLRKKWKKPEIFSGFFLLLGKQNQVFIGSYSVEAKRRLKSTCWRSKQEQISDRRPVFFRLKNRFSVFVICFWLASATKNCSDS